MLKYKILVKKSIFLSTYENVDTNNREKKDCGLTWNTITKRAATGSSGALLWNHCIPMNTKRNNKYVFRIIWIKLRFLL